MNKRDNHLEHVKRIMDNPIVACEGMNFDKAVRVFKSKFGRSHTMQTLKQRRDNPSYGERKRAKRYRALNRLRKKGVK